MTSLADEIGSALDVSMATNHHQIAINRAKIAGVIALERSSSAVTIGLVL